MEKKPSNKELSAAIKTLRETAPYVSVFPSASQDCLYTAASVLERMKGK